MVIIKIIAVILFAVLIFALIVLECVLIVVFAILACVFFLIGPQQLCVNAIKKLASWIKRQVRWFIRLFKELDHPLKKDGTWDKRFKINRK